VLKLKIEGQKLICKEGRVRAKTQRRKDMLDVFCVLGGFARDSFLSFAITNKG